MSLRHCKNLELKFSPVMKSGVTFFLIGILLANLSPISSQSVGGGVLPDTLSIACVSPEDYAYYQEMITLNQEWLDAQGTRLVSQSLRTNTVSFIWPVQKAVDTPYHSTWAISNYMDHNPNIGALTDWNCGERTYDTANNYHHQGVDIFTWPFWWKQMDEDQTEVIAAASGQIIFKNDGNYDRNCSFNSDLWNTVYIEHEDGSIAWYGHMKDGSLTDKGVGDAVTQGEYLGVIGSSGNSTGPHLHFEVYDSSSSLIDPYAGPCNSTITESWWSNQKPYENPGINAVLTHTDIPSFNSCPEAEDSFESTQFDPEDAVWFGSYFRDQQPGTSAFNEVFTPGGETYLSWNNNFDTFYPASWWVQQFNLSDEEGVWVYAVTYNGETVEHLFNVGQLSVEEEEFTELTVYPNPTSDLLQIASPIPMDSYELWDLNGRLLHKKDNVNGTRSTLDMSVYASGIYFIRAKTLDKDDFVTVRVIKR